MQERYWKNNKNIGVEYLPTEIFLAIYGTVILSNCKNKSIIVNKAIR